MAAIAALATFGLSAAGQTSTASRIGVSGDYRIGPGDVLDITIFEVEELSKPATVSPKGTVTLALLGEVAVAGLTTLEAESTLVKRYSQDLINNPQISVSVIDFRSQPISIIGAVKQPGVYQLQGTRRLVDVLAMAGGLTEEVGDLISIRRRADGEEQSVAEARLRASVLLSDDDQLAPGGLADHATDGEIRISVRALLREGRADSNPVIEPHDVIRVARAGVVYVLGGVVRPGGFPIKDQEPISVLRAVSLAEGLDKESAPQRARVIREVAGIKTEIPIQIDQILKGRKQDVQLRPEDVLYIPSSKSKKVMNRTTEAVVQMATGLVIWGR